MQGPARGVLLGRAARRTLALAKHVAIDDGHDRAEAEQQVSGGLAGAVLEGTDFASLLNKEFRPKSDTAKSAVGLCASMPFLPADDRSRIARTVRSGSKPKS